MSSLIIHTVRCLSSKWEREPEYELACTTGLSSRATNSTIYYRASENKSSPWVYELRLLGEKILINTFRQILAFHFYVEHTNPIKVRKD